MAISVEFVEEAEPLLLAANFTLRDFDSSDTPGTNLIVTLVLEQAVDGNSEGVRVVTSGGVEMEELDSTDPLTKVYALTNGSSYRQYEEVCHIPTIPVSSSCPITFSHCYSSGATDIDLLQY